ncbi:MAG: hypothetical protein HYZ83_00630 [Candidatus Omnitrophica bacterium]|nr:hypothetical protein [Candidatus Omnitrophota bacterium]
MLKAARLFKKKQTVPGTFGAWPLLVLLLAFPFSANAQSETAQFKKQEGGFYRDVFDQNIYDDQTAYLHLERLYRKISRHPMRAGNINEYDEVPDSAFFTNRHARSRLSESELQKGAGQSEAEGPDLSGNLTVTNSRFDGLLPTFVVTDAKGDEYLLKFDPVDTPELTTSSEIIAARFYHALGYNVPQNSIIKFEGSKLVPAEQATMMDDSGFKRKLTAEKLQEYVLFLPQEMDGRLRASATRSLEGSDKGFFHFKGRRKNDPNDAVDHSGRREIRALRVFSAWLNNSDVRESNTAERVLTENGQEILKHYLVDFNASLGSAGDGTKPPMFSHEYLFDYGEGFKAFISLGWWEKPWQKRWREAGEKVTHSPAVGYFDNRHFNPGRFKTQLPYYAFKDLTRADAFWAAKTLLTFSDDDLRAMVKAGELSEAQDEDYLVKTLAERRDMIAQYWFERTNPLDEFDVKDGKLVFKDLAIERGFASAEGTVYHVSVYPKRKGQASRMASRKIETTSLDLENWLDSAKALTLVIRTRRAGSAKKTPVVLVEVTPQGVGGIIHED